MDSISPIDNEIIFCRYWLKDQVGILSTPTNSEATHIRDLKVHKSVEPKLVWETIQGYYQVG